MTDRPNTRTRSRKKWLALFLLILLPSMVIASHEFSVRYFQDKTCTVCHEMETPVSNWKESGAHKNHKNCASCHFDAGFDGWMEMNKSAVRLFISHFERDPNEPIKPKEEPLFLEEDKEPGYWSHVPNSRCFKCKNLDTHQKKNQAKIHSKLIKNITDQPCKDCHNHEMRKGQKFYEKVLQPDEQSSTNGSGADQSNG